MNSRRHQDRVVSSQAWMLGLFALAALACSPTLPGGTLAAAGDGDDHGHSHGSTDDSPDPIICTLFTENLELFLEYPRLYPGVEARFLAHFTRLESGEPVRSGSLRLELAQSGILKLEVNAVAPTRDGLFIPVHRFQEEGEFDARLVLEGDGVHETVALPPIIVHANRDEAHAAAHEAAHHGPGEPVDGIPFLMEQQWTVGLLTSPVLLKTLKQELHVNGQVETPAGALAEVRSPLAGQLQAPTSGVWPALGAQVTGGQELARVAPHLAPGDKAQASSHRLAQATLSMELALRAFDLQRQRIEADGAAQLGQSTLSFAERKLERSSALWEESLGTIEEHERAQLEQDLAQRQLAGVKAQQTAYGEAQAALDTLEQDLAQRVQSPDGDPQSPAPLLAPITGIVQRILRVPGEELEQQGVLLEILNQDRVWIAAHVSEFDLSRMTRSPRARVQFEGGAGRAYPLGSPLTSVVPTFDAHARTLTLRYGFDNRIERLQAGRRADVFIETGLAVNAVTIPVESIVKDAGNPVAYVLIHGELFQKRPLTLGLRSAGFVQVLTGLEVGERVVSKGAHLLKLAAASPAAFGHGHAH